MARAWAFLRIVFMAHNDPGGSGMSPWKEIVYHPVMVFGLLGATLTSVATATSNVWVGIAAVAFTGAGAYITEHFTNSRRWVEETYGAKPEAELGQHEG